MFFFGVWICVPMCFQRISIKGGQPVFESVSREFCSFFWSVEVCFQRMFVKGG